MVDCRHPASLARFWAAALDGYDVAPYDDEELERLRRHGIHDPEDDPTVLVQGPVGSVRLWFQAVPEPKAVKNRLHLDLATDDVVTEARRLLGLGARRLDPQPPAVPWVVMVDPEGNEFCLTAA